MTSARGVVDDPHGEAELIEAVWAFIGSGALRVVNAGVERYPYGTASDERMRELAVRFRADPDAIVRIKHEWGEQNAAVPAEPSLVIRRLREWAESHRIDGHRLVQYWRTQWCHTSSPPPFERPALTEEEKGFWPDELAEYSPILQKDYSALDPKDLIWVIEEAEYFISPLHLRYFSPALAEHIHQVLTCTSRAGDSDEKTVKAIRKALPLPNPSEMVAGLRRAIWIRKIGPLDRVGSRPGWRELIPVIFELGSPDVASALLESAEPSVAFTVAQYADAVVSGETPARPEVPLDLLIATMERIATTDDHDASLYARVVLGQASREDLRKCRDPSCPVHGCR